MVTQYLKEWFREGKDLYLIENSGWFLLSVGLVVTILDLFRVHIPYGKFSESKGIIPKLLLTKVKMPAKLGWFLMESPSFLIPLYLILNVGGKYVGQANPNIVLLGMFILHYFNR